MLCVMANSVYVDGHYLNLPVMNEGGEIVGMVDVLKLTYATLEQVSIPLKNLTSIWIHYGSLTPAFLDQLDADP